MAFDEIGSNLNRASRIWRRDELIGVPLSAEGGCTAQTCMPKHAVFADSHGESEKRKPASAVLTQCG
jgi:hypothetical protein